MMVMLTGSASRPRRHVAFLLALMLAGCGDAPGGAEAELRAWVDAVREAAESKNRAAIVGRISPAYVDGRGNSRDDIDRTLRLYFLRQRDIALLPNVDDVRVIGGTAAEIGMTVGMAGTTGGVLGITADAYRFELELERQDGDWLLIAARWGELGEALR